MHFGSALCCPKGQTHWSAPTLLSLTQKTTRRAKDAAGVGTLLAFCSALFTRPQAATAPQAPQTAAKIKKTFYRRTPNYSISARAPCPFGAGQPCVRDSRAVACYGSDSPTPAPFLGLGARSQKKRLSRRLSSKIPPPIKWQRPIFAPFRACCPPLRPPPNKTDFCSRRKLFLPLPFPPFSRLHRV